MLRNVIPSGTTGTPLWKSSWKSFLFGLFFICLLQGSIITQSQNILAAEEAQPPKPLVTGTDSVPFDPAVDGFSFPNFVRTDLSSITSVEMRRLFGNSVCAGAVAENGSCKLSPPAEKWMEWANSTTRDGNCEGLAVMSSLMYHKMLAPKDFGADTANALVAPYNEALQREITYWSITGLLNRETTVKSSPNEVLAALRASIDARGTPFGTLRFSMLNGFGGHAVLPISVADGTGNTVVITVYDVNYPGQTREMVIDTEANSWFYSPDASLTEDDYTGDAQSQTLGFSPIEPRLGQQICSFCKDSVSAAQHAGTGEIRQQTIFTPTVDVFASPEPEVIMKKQDNMFSAYDGAKGTTLGQLDPHIKPMSFAILFPGVNQTGLQVTGIPSWKLPPRGSLSGSVEITQTIDIIYPQDAADAITTSITYLGPGYVFEIGELYEYSGQTDKLEIAAGGQEITYETSTGEVPELYIGIETVAADFGLLFDFFYPMLAEDTVKLGIDAKQGLVSLRLNTSAEDETTLFDLYMIRVDDVSEEEFVSIDEFLYIDETLLIDYKSWDGNGNPLRMGVDENENGILDPEEEFFIQGESPSLYLPLIGR